MRILLSTIGTRGEVQPMLALALALRECGHEAHLCVPPDFCALAVAMGFPATALGPSLRPLRPAAPATPPSPQQMRDLAEQSLSAQFATIAEAARGCDMMVGGGALQIAAPSIAQKMGLPYVFAAFCPVALPSPHHAPPVYTTVGEAPVSQGDAAALWMRDAQRWNLAWREALNRHRAALELPAVEDVRSHVLTARPWLAADRELAPWPGSADAVLQTGAWMISDQRPLGDDIRAFLAAGDAPVYIGFGSATVQTELGAKMIAAARAVGRRCIVSQGWAGLVGDAGSDCLTIGDVNHEALFRQVAAVVHHGGAGTTTVAALAGVPQLIVPHQYDQFYWARRVCELGIGAQAERGADGEALASSLAGVLLPASSVRGRLVSTCIDTGGAVRAVQYLSGAAAAP